MLTGTAVGSGEVTTDGAVVGSGEVATVAVVGSGEVATTGAGDGTAGLWEGAVLFLSGDG